MVVSSGERDSRPVRPRADAGSSPPEPRVLDSTELMLGSREIVIRHGADRYRLRVTGKDKLILTK